jgi:hypothetical protein
MTMIMNTLIGAIAISIAISIVYCIGRIVIRCMLPETQHPDIESPCRVTAIGLLTMCIITIVMIISSKLGEAVLRALQ